jgi:hypothetical protein
MPKVTHLQEKTGRVSEATAIGNEDHGAIISAALPPLPARIKWSRMTIHMRMILTISWTWVRTTNKPAS